MNFTAQHKPAPPARPRKVIQIAMVSTTAINGDPRVETVALCDDGTMWELTGSAQWVEMPAIPQPCDD